MTVLTSWQVWLCVRGRLLLSVYVVSMWLFAAMSWLLLSCALVRKMRALVLTVGRLLTGSLACGDLGHLGVVSMMLSVGCGL